MSPWLASGRLTVVLAWLTAVAALGLWLIVLPLFAMGAVDAGPVYRVMLVLAFFGWPVAGVLAIVAARTVHRRPRKAAALLLVAAAALAFPFFLLPVLPLTAAILAFRLKPPAHQPFP